MRPVRSTIDNLTNLASTVEEEIDIFFSKMEKTGKSMMGYVKNRLMHRHTFTMIAKLKPPSFGRLRVMISLVSGPYDKYPAAPKVMYKVVMATIVVTK